MLFRSHYSLKNRDRRSELGTEKGKKMEQNEIVSKDILNLLPHRYPFLLVDRVVAFEKMHSVHAIKCVTFNEPFFQGHFPGYPVMPGVLILEAMAQASGVLILKSHPDDLQGKIFLFAGLENVHRRTSRYRFVRLKRQKRSGHHTLTTDRKSVV